MTLETRHLDIQGLNCPNCAAKVERAVAGLSGVHKAEVRFESEHGRIEFDPGQITIEQIAYTIGETGCDSKQFTIALDGEEIQPSSEPPEYDEGALSAGEDDGDGVPDADEPVENRPPF